MKPLVGRPPDQRRDEITLPAAVDLIVPRFPAAEVGHHLYSFVTIPSENGRSVTNSHFKLWGFSIRLRRFAVLRATGRRSCISAQMPNHGPRDKRDGNGSPLLSFHQNTIPV
ncbi:hypothetical protein ELH73_11625 [Rhizobium leguminosarum]|uniref:Uncharacterized protein n=1 Tax=Rhizobium leguminosarum TaxID=384 RepID=A0ABD7PRP7_RHILE|nr:hypothetical protein ELI28_11255 [Rhizobium leguminosarum]TAV78656.1 hypothetical protein ELI27_11245 [Rhizobium leguminosarum]TAW30069.1 hypothetical protein ELI19_11435 [Rhizobium leguminosarum]TAW43797.1 hypothetical protein ELI18_11385 [Rhizobium leguminosarum]TAX34949.1 hypothetical protein ELI06_11860 [Rhizobium leguminosarum]